MQTDAVKEWRSEGAAHAAFTWMSSSVAITVLMTADFRWLCFGNGKDSFQKFTHLGRHTDTQRFGGFCPSLQKRSIQKKAASN